MVVSKSENNLSSPPCQIETNIYRLHIQKTGSAEYLCEISKNAAIAADHGRLNSYEKTLDEESVKLVLEVNK